MTQVPVTVMLTQAETVQAIADEHQAIQDDMQAQLNLFSATLGLKQATSTRLFGVKNRAAVNRNERVVGVTLS